MKINNSKSKIKPILISCATLLVVAVLCYGAYAKTADLWPFSRTSADETTNNAPTNTVDYSGPTEEDTANSQNAKKELIKEQEQAGKGTQEEAPNPQQKKKATVGVSYANIYDGKLEVRAFTPSVIEGDGTCTITVSKNESEPIIRKVKAFIDASSTICEPVYIPQSQLSTGIWSVEVSYLSATHKGTSGKYEVEIK